MHRSCRLKTSLKACYVSKKKKKKSSLLYFYFLGVCLQNRLKHYLFLYSYPLTTYCMLPGIKRLWYNYRNLLDNTVLFIRINNQITLAKESQNLVHNRSKLFQSLPDYQICCQSNRTTLLCTNFTANGYLSIRNEKNKSIDTFSNSFSDHFSVGKDILCTPYIPWRQRHRLTLTILCSAIQKYNLSLCHTHWSQWGNHNIEIQKGGGGVHSWATHLCAVTVTLRAMWVLVRVEVPPHEASQHQRAYE